MAYTEFARPTLLNAKSVLSTLQKPRILELAQELEILVDRSATKEKQIDALLRRKSTGLSDILRALGRDELKRICRSHALDSTGRSRQLLIDRLLGQSRAESELRRPVLA